jgi:hypothetical protein
MTSAMSIGQVPWSREDMLATLEEFSSLYDERPIADNRGGMRSPHMFMTWFALRMLQPQAVVESGVWLGQGTWFIERACPNAQLFCIEPNLNRIQYRSKRAQYFDRDFSTIDWSHLPKHETLLFFDDHQNAYERIKTAKWFGFTHLIIEDNYPPSQGDCYSLKRAFMHSGFKCIPRRGSFSSRFKQKLRALAGAPDSRYRDVAPNEVDAKCLRQNLEVYYEFPPVFKTERTRWGDRWDDEKYPTPEPLLKSVERECQQPFMDEAVHYTWICYAKLR